MVWDPRVGPGVMAGSTSAAGGILDFLKRQYQQKFAGQPMAPVGPMMGMTWPGAGGPSGLAGAGADLPPVSQPSIFTPPAAPQPIPLPGAQTPGGIPGGAPSTKMDPTPRTPLQFSWGGRTPQNYTAGQTDILKMEGAPQRREGFMGAAPTFGGRTMRDEAGEIRNAALSFTPGGTALEQYQNTANPMGFTGFQDLPAVAEIAKAAVDPAWREKETARAAEEAAGEQARLTAKEQMDLLQQQREQDIERAVQAQIAVIALQEGVAPEELPPEKIAQIRAMVMSSALGGGLGFGVQ